MNDMRKLINLMEGVMPVPGIDEDGPGTPENSLSSWQKDALANLYTYHLGKTSFPDKARQNTKDSALAGGIIKSSQIPDLEEYLNWYDEDETHNSSDAEKNYVDDLGWGDIGSEFDPKLGEKAPPGEEALVKDLKKEYPGHPEKAFATAWSIYNKKHGKTDEGIELGNEDDVTPGWYIVAHDGMIASGPYDTDKEARRVARYFQWFDPVNYSFEYGLSDQDGMFVDMDGNEFEESIPAVDSCQQSNPNNADKACAMEGVSSPAIHVFDDSRQAYDSTQTGEWRDGNTGQPVEVKDGDILVIPDEGVVGLCSTWPVAITKNPGKLHQMKAEYSTPEDIAEVTNLSIESVMAAFKKAEELGLETVGGLEEDFNNGYDTDEYAYGNDFFPNGADSPVVKKVGPSGARQGDNPEQKKMQIDEIIDPDMAQLLATGAGAFLGGIGGTTLASRGHGKSRPEHIQVELPGKGVVKAEVTYKNPPPGAVEVDVNGKIADVWAKTGITGKKYFAKIYESGRVEKDQLTELHKELVYGYRKYLKESKK